MLENLFGALKAIIGGSSSSAAAQKPKMAGRLRGWNHVRQDAEALASGGVSEMNVQELLSIADGAIVGTSLKRDGRVSNPVDAA